MVTLAREKLRGRLRQPGRLARGCLDCALLNDCGGLEADFPLLNCLEVCCSLKSRGKCECVCPRKPADFAARLNEVKGFGWSDIAEIRQGDIGLPEYVPMIHHSSRRTEMLDYPVVALSTYNVIRLKQGHYTTVATSAAELRTHFRLATDTQIILRGTAKDGPLELYWEYQDAEGAAEQLRALGILAVIGPNFSHFLNVPRTDNLFNRKRQLICLAELSRAGHHTIPHLSAVRPADWRFWLDFLKANKTIRHVAIEFQTGNKNKTEGLKQLVRLEDLCEKLGRPLNPILIGGTQYHWYTATRFRNFTLIDSTPFMKSINRRRLKVVDGQCEWEDGYSLERQPLDHIFGSNLRQYGTMVRQETDRAREWSQKGPAQ